MFGYGSNTNVGVIKIHKQQNRIGGNKNLMGSKKILKNDKNLQQKGYDNYERKVLNHKSIPCFHLL